MKVRLLVSLLLLSALSGCQSAYYAGLEKLGIEKREIMVDRVEAARDEQEEAKETFADALETFSAFTQFEGGELETAYKKINGAYDDASGAADRVRQRIDRVEDVAESLFQEWQAELNEYQSASRRQSSEQSLRDTRRQYEQMIQKMRRAEQSMDPVLALFKDQVLFLKHNLNARAIAALGTEVAQIERRVADLVREMESSIDEANAFIGRL